jgi:hypothetical protein
MLELLVAFTLYRFDAHWIWWVMYGLLIGIIQYEKNCTK